MRKLTGKQRRFVQEYLIDLNGTQAAIRSGYSPHTANEIAAQNLAKLSIQLALADAIAERKKAATITPEWVLAKLQENAEKAMQENQRGVANRSLELIAKHLGMFPEISPACLTVNNNQQTIHVVYDTPPPQVTNDHHKGSASSPLSLAPPQAS